MPKIVAAAIACGLAVTTARAQVVRPVLQFPKELVSSVTIDPSSSALTLNTTAGAIALADVRRVL